MTKNTIKIAYLLFGFISLSSILSIKAQDYNANGNINLLNNKFIKGTRELGGTSKLIGFEPSGQRIAISEFSTIPAEVRIYTPSDPGQGVSIYSNELIAFFKNNGRVGIGTKSPKEKLDIRGKVKVNNALIINGIELGNPSAKVEQIRLSGYGILGNRELFYISNEHPKGQINFYAGGRHGAGSHLIIKNSGNIGIGTKLPDAKLAVNGNIHTKEVKVDLSGALVPDYVFNENYKLLTFQQIKEFIKKNGHLPNIPSAQEMNEEGVYLKEMNLKLLEKIEELTLYLLKQDERIKILEDQISK